MGKNKKPDGKTTAQDQQGVEDGGSPDGESKIIVAAEEAVSTDKTLTDDLGYDGKESTIIIPNDIKDRHEILPEFIPLYEEQLHEFLGFFDATLKDLVDVVQERKTVDIHEVVEGLLERQYKEHNMPEEHQKLAHDLAEAALTTDEVTGALAQKFHPLLESMGDILAQTTGMDVVKFQADVSNMNAANLAIGRRNVDEALDVINGIYKKHFKAAGATYIGETRDGGDEFGSVIVGLTEEQVKIASRAAEKEIDAVMEEAGLNMLVHSKYPDKITIDISEMDKIFAEDVQGKEQLVEDIVQIYVDELNIDKANGVEIIGDEINIKIGVVLEEDRADSDMLMIEASKKVDSLLEEKGYKGVELPTEFVDKGYKRGFSAGSGAVALGKGREESHIQGLIDVDTEKRKDELGAERVARSNELRAQNVKIANNRQFSPHDFNMDKGFTDEDKERRFHNLIVAKTVILDKKQELEVNGLIPTKKENMWPEEIFPTKNIDLNVSFPDPEKKRAAAVEEVIISEEIDPKSAAILRNMREFYDQRDYVSKMKTSRDYVDDIEGFQELGGHIIIADIEMENLSGLNSVLGHHNADTVKHHAAAILKEKVYDGFGEDASNNLYDRGGAKFSLVLNADAPRSSIELQQVMTIEEKQLHLQDVIAGAARAFEEELQDATVENYVGRLVTDEQKKIIFDGDQHPVKDQLILDIVHPKRPNVKGTGMEYTTLQLQSREIMPAKEHLNMMDLIKENAISMEPEPDNVEAQQEEKTDVNRGEIVATWTTASRGQTGRIETSTGRERERAEGEEIGADKRARPRPEENLGGFLARIVKIIGIGKNDDKGR